MTKNSLHRDIPDFGMSGQAVQGGCATVCNSEQACYLRTTGQHADPARIGPLGQTSRECSGPAGAHSHTDQPLGGADSMRVETTCYPHQPVSLHTCESARYRAAGNSEDLADLGKRCATVDLQRVEQTQVRLVEADRIHQLSLCE